MILPMKKVSIVLLNKERENALLKLRKIGLVHLEKIDGSSEKLSLFKEQTNNALLSESILGEIKLSKKEKKEKPEVLSKEQVINLCKQICDKNDRKKQLTEEINANLNELERFKEWGSVNLDDFEYLSKNGVQLKMFEIPSDKYVQIDSEIDTLLVNKDKKNSRFVLINSGNERPSNLLPEAYEVPLPRISTNLLEKEILENKAEIESINKFYYENAKYLSFIVDFRKNLQTDIEFENIYAGMGHESDGKENDLAWISGYVPEEDISVFLDECKKNEWAVACSDPDVEDTEIPTKLKNNKLVSLIYPLTDFLGTVPGYNEFDISGWFLLFFTIFFGMIFGDGGYGLLVTAIALILMLKNMLKKKPFSPMIGLVLLLGGATVVWGAVTCTWFGIAPELLPDWIKNLSVPLISSAYEDAIWTPSWMKGTGLGLSKSQNLQIFCFTLALIQLSVAHVKAAARNFKEKKALKAIGDIGSLLQLIGMFWVVLAMVVSADVFPMFGSIGNVPVGKIEISLIAIGFVMSFVFANYEGSIVKSILESLKNIISVLLGVVNVFSDIVSYIRLWAVGLAGAAISNTVNTLAGPVLGHAFMFIFAILLLVFGHGLNMILNLLSVIVHGVRLNTLEFSTHIGVSWAGKKYSPFAEKN